MAEPPYDIDTEVTLITDIILPSEIVAYHGKKIQLLEDKTGNRVYDDDMLEGVMNTIIEFIIANSPLEADENLRRSAIKRLCRDEFNNRMHEDGRLKNWTQIDVMDKAYLLKLLEKRVEGEEPVQEMTIHNNTVVW